MRHIDLFSGIGGFALAARQLGWKTIAFSEIDEYSVRLYRRHFPEARALGDIREITWSQHVKKTGADNLVVTAGFPCQPHSIAGRRNGEDDPRDLWNEVVRCLRSVRPRYALFENVAGALSSNDGKFFATVLSSLAESGYDVIWDTVPASYVGAPHTRKRIWIMAYASRVGVQRLWTKRLQESNIHEQEVLPLRASQGFRTGRDQWETEPSLGDMADGISVGLAHTFADGAPARIVPVTRVVEHYKGRAERIRALGNAIVPQIAHNFLSIIQGVENAQ